MEISLKPYADTITLKDILYQIALFRFNMTMGLCGGMGWDGMDIRKVTRLTIGGACMTLHEKS